MTIAPDAYGVWDTVDNKWWVGPRAAYHGIAAAKSSWLAAQPYYIHIDGKLTHVHPKWKEQTRFVVLPIWFSKEPINNVQ